MAQVGFIGLGAMGSRAARRLLDAGHSVIGYNRTAAKAEALANAGMRRADSPRAVAQSADVIFSMVTDDAALHDIAEGDAGVLGGLAAGKIWVDMSTVSPVTSRALGEKARQRGVALLDAPVAGSPLMVEQGAASIMVSGDRTAFERAEPAIRDISPKVTYLGAAGNALILKLAGNLNLAVQMLAFSEGILLAEKNGIPRQTAVEVLLGGALASPMLKYRGPFALQLPDPAWFDVGMMQKDLQLALEVAQASATPLPTTAVANEFLTAARGMGLATEDFAAIFQVLARLAGQA
jgi:3-hydroxyisobutyrate dehydrogenase-like beta-hydroxyacid dehydrogenase